ncbi:uncharacterized protein LOC128206503 [Mya arenaria]|uniref:uncharacterized protein LOC128206503 n=1 Tax=Mya arenaria TaxID=6604 RepID=UPI0022E4885A|nr:uncharacterized protein LOC128206503 [Mya arenaria]
MKVLIALFACIVVATAFDCFGQNSSCAMSHVKCDTGYEPFCEHMPNPMGQRVGICTCDKECQSASECTNLEADGCPPHAHAMCDLMNHVCHCGPPHTNQDPINDSH